MSTPEQESPAIFDPADLPPSTRLLAYEQLLNEAQQLVDDKKAVKESLSRFSRPKTKRTAADEVRKADKNLARLGQASDWIFSFPETGGYTLSFTVATVNKDTDTPAYEHIGLKKTPFKGGADYKAFVNEKEELDPLKVIFMHMQSAWRVHLALQIDKLARELAGLPARQISTPPDGARRNITSQPPL